MDKRYRFFKRLTVYIIFFIVLLFALIKSQQFLTPILLAILFAYLLYPIGKFLEAKGVPRIPSNLIAIIVGIVVLVAGISFIAGQVSQLTENISQFRNQASGNIDKLAESVSSLIGIPTSRLAGWARQFTENLLQGSGQFFGSVFAATASTIVRILLMPVFVFFLLYYRNKVHDFIIDMVAENRKEQAEKILNEINSVTIKYMTGIVIVVAILSVTHSIGLSIIGLEFAILLGVIAAIFNFIPYFGTLIGAIFPLFYAFLTADDLNVLLWVVIYFLVIQFVENNILTPNITGGKVRLNPFVTILSLILGSMIWGVAGMFLIVPYMAMVRIFCEHIDFLKPVGFLLSDRGTEKHALSGKKIKKLFKKK